MAGLLRIIAEYQEPMARFRRERIQDTVVFFGSARFRALDVAQGAGAAGEYRLERTCAAGGAAGAPEEVARGEA